MIRQIKFIFIAVLILSNLQANLINPNFNLNYALSISAETNNRQIHKDEEKWLDENVDRFIEQQAKEGKFYSQQEARALLYTSAKYAVDGMENALINLFGSDFSKDEIINAQDFILSNTYGLKFRESGAEFGKEFDAFRPDDHDFYSDYNPNAIGALEDNSLFFVPVGRIAQGASGAIIRTTSGVFGRVAGSIGNKIEANALTKITENLPKNYTFTDGIITSQSGTKYTFAGIDAVTQKPIWNMSDSLGRNYYYTFINGARETAKTPIMQISQGSSTAINTAKNGAENLYNKYLSNPNLYNNGALNFIEGFLPGIPPYSKIGYGTGITVNVYEKYKEIKNKE